jgi:hypothetical protein
MTERHRSSAFFRFRALSSPGARAILEEEFPLTSAFDRDMNHSVAALALLAKPAAGAAIVAAAAVAAAASTG